MTGTVKVHNVSLKASEQDISEFFSFSGDIVHVELQSCDDRSQFAYLTFRDNQGAERAMLLTGATIADMAVIITPASGYKLPASVLADLENAGGMESALRKAEDVVGSMLAKGFVLGMDAVEKAKAFDEKHQLTSTATAKVASLDKTMGLNEKMKEMDEKYQVAEKTKSALAAAEQTVSTAGSAIMSNRYVLTGAAWVTGAYSKVATTATDVGAMAKERMMADQEGEHLDRELEKTHLLESSEASEQECKRQEGSGNLESPATTQQESNGQEADHQMTNVPGNTETVTEEHKNQEGGIAVAHAQESTEIAETEPNNHETELSKANITDSLLMSEQTEQEHKQPNGESAKTHVPGSPVTIPVTMATTDGNSSNSPKKPESAQGFL
ncbi:hypothetical protein HU200_017751 [Digitaria exilis]|uniref:RRM domain-containing protein n=1 Tax=Digitaria exilis TaxID=1010633 RepID=A0A835F6E4_9POAL|nr:hypothetical protein HU200_017751 [Digitaria exilis]